LATTFKDKNVLILYDRVEKHGDILYEMLTENHKDFKTHYIHGGIKGVAREKIRKEVDANRNNILLASYGTTARGINIVNLDYLIFAQTFKAKIRNLQSIGRVLRRGSDKDKSTLFDLADDLSSDKYDCHTLRHFYKRLKIYAKEGFDYEILNHKL